MSTESEAVLEDRLIKLLSSNGYEFVKIKDEDELNQNFRNQFEKFNDIELSDEEFDRLLIYMDQGSIFDKAKKLRDKYPLVREDETIHLDFLNQKEWCKNIFQVSNQITMRGEHENRYDVTLLINGLPLVQIELKRRGMDIKKAFNQIKRYYKNSFKKLFNYIQIFVISNGNNTKYFANANVFKDINEDQTFFWKKKNNENIRKLDAFAETFLEKCHIAKMISQYMVLNEEEEKIIVLRAYQKYAVEAILEQALEHKQNGYIWHTTGSGKTLTSFKVSKLLSKEKSVDKVLFVVDRKDLDDQTSKEFNKFSPGSIIDVANTNKLVEKLVGDDELIVTTIQKLDNAVKRDSKSLQNVKDKHIIFIYDECHRSQFGTMHDNIENYFNNSLSYGFTGTPIFTINSNGEKTTKDVFGKRLHSYLIKDAIADENVLGFSIDYWKTAKSKKIKDEEVKSIDTKEVLESDQRIGMICDYIVESYNAKTRNGMFNAMLTVSQGPVIHKYYKYLRERNPELKIACIYTYDANGEFTDEMQDRDYLDKYIDDYNKMFHTQFTSERFDLYQKDISKRMKKRLIDLLLVKDMFLTGFDSKNLNTLYVDKNMVYHTLLQAYSRTNRLNGKLKPHGNIVCFRNLKKDTDEAIRLFSDNAPLEEILMYDYEHYVKIFNDLTEKLYKLVKTVEEAYDLISEKEKEEFVLIFRDILRTKNKLDNFTEFTFENLIMDEQEFNDFKGAYLDIYDGIKPGQDEKVSILDDIDFELELISTEKVNVDYILELLENLDPKEPSYQNDVKGILKLVNESEKLRSKIELIERFITEKIGDIGEKPVNVGGQFDDFMSQEKNKAVSNLIQKEKLDSATLAKIISEYEFSEKFDEDLVEESFIDKGLGIIARIDKRERVMDKIREVLAMFEY